MTADCSDGSVTRDDFRLARPPSLQARGAGWRTMATSQCVWEIDSTGPFSSRRQQHQGDLKMYSQRFGTFTREFKGPTPKAVIIVSTGCLCGRIEGFFHLLAELDLAGFLHLGSSFLMQQGFEEDKVVHLPAIPPTPTPSFSSPSPATIITWDLGVLFFLSI